MATRTPQESSAAPVQPPGDRLDSWKEIAAYLKRDERTVRRWEKSEGLPIRRHTHHRQASVYAYKSELDAWWHNNQGAPVEEDARPSAENAIPPAHQPPAELPLSAVRGRSLGRYAAVAAVLLIVVAAAGKLWITPKAATPVAGPQRIVLLPFRNVSADSATSFMSRALPEAIADQLTFYSSLSLPFQERARNYNESSVDPATAARELHADLVLLGSFSAHLTQEWVVTVELHDARARTVRWRKDFSTSVQGLPNLPQRVAQELAASLGVSVSNAKPDPPHAGREERLAAEAVLHYFRGVQASVQRNNPASLKHLDAALALAPEFAQAQALKSRAFTGALYEQSLALTAKRLDEAAALFRTAIASGHVSPATLSLGGLFLMELGRLEDGAALLEEAVRLNPEYAPAHYWRSQAFRYAGLLEESVHAAERAIQLDPYAQELSTLNAYLYLGRYDEFLQKMPATQTQARALFYRGMAHYSRGDHATAEREFAAATGLDPALPHSRFGLALLQRIRGNTAEGLRVLRELEAMQPPDGEMRYKLAQCAAALGDRAAALRHLRGTLDAQFSCYDCFARDPLLASLRGDAAFAALLDEARQRQAHYRARLLRGIASAQRSGAQ